MRSTITFLSLLLFLPLILAVAPISSSTMTGDETIKKKTTDGKVIEMELVISGKVSLYKLDRSTQAIPLQAAYTPYSQYFDYFVGYEDSFLVQKLGHENYKVILHRILGRVSNWTHQFDIEKIQYEEVDRLVQEFNEEYK